MGRTKKYAVLTGDIVESSKLDAEQLSMARKALQEIIKDFMGICPNTIVGGVAFFRGDGWQLLLAEPRYLLRLLLFISCGLKLRRVNNSRIGVAVGAVEAINYENISLSTGEAFTESGRILNDIEKMKVKKDKPFWRLGDKNIYRAMLFELLSSLANDWTYAVAQTIYFALKSKNQKEIADETGVVRQTIANNLIRGKWDKFENILRKEEKSRSSCGLHIDYAASTGCH